MTIVPALVWLCGLAQMPVPPAVNWDSVPLDTGVSIRRAEGLREGVSFLHADSSKSRSTDSHDLSQQLSAAFDLVNNSILKKHRIYVCAPADWLSEEAVIIVGNDGSRSEITEKDYLVVFNNMMEKESLCVTSDTLALEIAKLLLRMIFPNISYRSAVFFAYELSADVKTYFREHIRSELATPRTMLYTYRDYCRYQQYLKRQLKKTGPGTRIECKRSSYRTTVVVACFTVDWRSRGHRLVHWHLDVHRDGTVHTKIPKGVRWCRSRELFYLH